MSQSVDDDMQLAYLLWHRRQLMVIVYQNHLLQSAIFLPLQIPDITVSRWSYAISYLLRHRRQVKAICYHNHPVLASEGVTFHSQVEITVRLKSECKWLCGYGNRRQLVDCCQDHSLQPAMPTFLLLQQSVIINVDGQQQSLHADLRGKPLTQDNSTYLSLI